jgi:hypothetical protein
VEKLSNKVCDQITNFVEVSQKLTIRSWPYQKKTSPSKPGYNLRVFFPLKKIHLRFFLSHFGVLPN